MMRLLSTDLGCISHYWKRLAVMIKDIYLHDECLLPFDKDMLCNLIYIVLLCCMYYVSYCKYMWIYFFSNQVNYSKTCDEGTLKCLNWDV